MWRCCQTVLLLLSLAACVTAQTKVDAGVAASLAPTAAPTPASAAKSGLTLAPANQAQPLAPVKSGAALATCTFSVVGTPASEPAASDLPVKWRLAGLHSV